MVETGAITREQADRAKATPLKLAAPNVEASDAPYFVDLVKDQLSNQYNESELNEQAMRIYTTLDPDLQRAAAEAVEVGMKLVDEQVLKLRTHKTKVGTGDQRQDRGNRRLRTAAAGRGRRSRSSYRRGAGAGRRPQLRHQPARSRRRQASHRIDLQTLCLRRCGQYRPDRQEDLRRGHRTRDWRQCSAHHRLSGAPGIFTPATLVDDSQVSIAYGDTGLRTSQLSRGLPRRSHRPLCAGHVAEQRDRARGAGCRIRQGGRARQGRRHHQRARNAVDRAWLLRRQPAGDVRRLHRLRQWRHASFAHDGEVRPRRPWRRAERLPQRLQGGARSRAWPTL